MRMQQIDSSVFIFCDMQEIFRIYICYSGTYVNTVPARGLTPKDLSGLPVCNLLHLRMRNYTAASSHIADPRYGSFSAYRKHDYLCGNRTGYQSDQTGTDKAANQKSKSTELSRYPCLYAFCIPALRQPVYHMRHMDYHHSGTAAGRCKSIEEKEFVMSTLISTILGASIAFLIKMHDIIIPPGTHSFLFLGEPDFSELEALEKEL